MKKRGIICGVLALAWFLSPGLWGDVSRPATAADMGVYASYLRNNFESTGGDGGGALKSFVLPRQFSDARFPKRRHWESYLLSQITGPDKPSPETLGNFLNRPERLILLDDFPKGGAAVAVVDRSRLEAIFQKGGWDEFWRLFPGSSGLMFFSAVGYNARGNEAVFTTRLACGNSCEYRNLVFMKKLKGDWVVIYRELLP